MTKIIPFPSPEQIGTTELQQAWLYAHLLLQFDQQQRCLNNALHI